MGHLPKDHNRPSDMIFASASQFHVYIVLIVKVLKEKALIVIGRGLLRTLYFVKVRCQL